MKFEDVAPLDLIVSIDPNIDNCPVYLVAEKTDEAVLFTSGLRLLKGSPHWEHIEPLTGRSASASADKVRRARELHDKIQALRQFDPEDRFKKLVRKADRNALNATEEAARISEVLLEALEKLKDIE